MCTAAPVFTTPADDASPLEGDDATFRCEARGDPTPTIAWSLNGKPLSGGWAGLDAIITVNQAGGWVDFMGESKLR